MMKKTWLRGGVCSALVLALSGNVWAEGLLQIYQKAVSEDPTYQSALYNYQAVGENTAIAKAPLFPQLSASANVNYGKRDLSAAKSGRGYSLNLTQTLVDYGQWQTLSQANLQVNQAEVVLAAARQTLMLDVATAYFNVLEAQDNLVAAKAQVDSLKNNLEKVEQQHNVGVKPMSDVLDARSSYDQARADLIQKDNAVATSFESLRAITGVKYHHLAPLKPNLSFSGPLPDDISFWQNHAKAGNLDVKKSQFDQKISKKQISINRAGHWPTLSLQLSYSYANDPTGAITTVPGKRHNAAISLVLNVPIFSGGLISAQTQQAINQYDAASYDLVKAQRTAESSARQDFLGMKAQLSSIRAFEAAVKADQMTVKTYEASYAVGVSTMLDVLRAIKNLNTDQQQLAKARYEYLLDYLSLKNSTGDLKFSDLEQVNSWLAV